MFRKQQKWISLYNNAKKRFDVIFIKKNKMAVIEDFEHYFKHEINLSTSEYDSEIFEDLKNNCLFFICSKEKYNNSVFNFARRMSRNKKVIIIIYDYKLGNNFLANVNSSINNTKCCLKRPTLIIGFSLLLCIAACFSLVFCSFQHTRALFSPIQSISETITQGTKEYAIWDINFNEKDMATENKNISDFIYKNYSHYQWSNRRTYYDSRVFLKYGEVKDSLELVTMDQDNELINPDFCYFDLKCLTSNLFYGYRNSSDNCVITKTIADNMFDFETKNNNYDSLIKKTISLNVGEKKYDFLITAVVDDTDKSFSCLNSLVGNKCVFIQTRKIIESTASAHIITYGNDGTQKGIMKYLLNKDGGVINKVTVKLSDLTKEYDFLNEYRIISKQKIANITLSVVIDFLFAIVFFLISLAALKVYSSFYPCKNNYYKTIIFVFVSSIFLYICSFVQNKLDPISLTSETISYSNNTASCILYIISFFALLLAYLVAFGFPFARLKIKKRLKFIDIEI